jgi:pimeloyl-ACP methyl ester carboxylesterase
MSTADNARDMDVIRQSVGDDKLSFYGLSYGSLLGSTYASMFPDRVRAIAIDAVIDPVPWTTGEQPPFIRVGSNRTMSESLTSALARCDRANILQCPLTGNALARWQRVRKSLTDNPLTVGGQTLDGKTFVDDTHQAFQLDHIVNVPAPTIPLWLTAVKLIEVLRFPGVAPAAARSKLTVAGVEVDLSAPKSALTQELEALLEKLRTAAESSEPDAESGDVTAGMAKTHGVWCLDTQTPRDRQTWIDAGRSADVDGLGIGPTESWSASVCRTWTRSAQDAYRGPFGAKTATPLLVIGLTHDTVTGIGGARGAAARFPGSRVIAVDSWGHTALGRSSQCLKPATDAYLISQKLPEKDLVCEPDEGLFGLAP